MSEIDEDSNNSQGINNTDVINSNNQQELNIEENNKVEIKVGNDMNGKESESLPLEQQQKVCISTDDSILKEGHTEIAPSSSKAIAASSSLSTTTILSSGIEKEVKATITELNKEVDNIVSSESETNTKDEDNTCSLLDLEIKKDVRIENEEHTPLVVLQSCVSVKGSIETEGKDDGVKNSCIHEDKNNAVNENAVVVVVVDIKDKNEGIVSSLISNASKEESLEMDDGLTSKPIVLVSVLDNSTNETSVEADIKCIISPPSEDKKDNEINTLTEKGTNKIPRKKRKLEPNDNQHHLLSKIQIDENNNVDSKDTRIVATFDKENNDEKSSKKKKSNHTSTEEKIIAFSDGEEVVVLSSSDSCEDMDEDYFTNQPQPQHDELLDENEEDSQGDASMGTTIVINDTTTVLSPSASINGNANIENEMDTVSLNVLKQAILGRPMLHQDDDDITNKDVVEDAIILQQIQQTEINKEGTIITKQTTSSLKRELTCVICQDIFYKPVTLLCGHSFCKECIDWWYDSTFKADVINSLTSSNANLLSCPTCRSTTTPWMNNDTSLGVNKALQSCVVSLFGVELMKRMKAKKKQNEDAVLGERNGIHTRGYEVLIQAYCEEWTVIPIHMSLEKDDDLTIIQENSKSCNISTTMKARRSIVLDDENQVMQFALAIQGVPQIVFLNNNMNDTSTTMKKFININICLLHMEEDEVIDNDGFPLVVYPKDECLICTDEGRFGSSFIELHSKHELRQDGTNTDSSLTTTPIARREFSQLNYNVLEFTIDYEEYCFLNDDDDDDDDDPNARLIFRHDETGTELEIDLLLGSNTGDERDRKSYSKPTRRRQGYLMDDIDAQAQSDNEDDDEDEDDEEDLNEFEDDGFLVVDDDSDQEEEEEEDNCQICGHGGELIVCDGGEWLPGCGSAFHITCIDRLEVPHGDWICQDCSSTTDKETGIRGYEFTIESDVDSGANDHDDDDDNESENSCNEEEVLDEEANSMIQRLIVLDDDDDDECSPAIRQYLMEEKGSKRRCIVVDTSEDEEEEEEELKSDTSEVEEEEEEEELKSDSSEVNYEEEEEELKSDTSEVNDEELKSDCSEVEEELKSDSFMVKEKEEQQKSDTSEVKEEEEEELKSDSSEAKEEEELKSDSSEVKEEEEEELKLDSSEVKEEEEEEEQKLDSSEVEGEKEEEELKSDSCEVEEEEDEELKSDSSEVKEEKEEDLKLETSEFKEEEEEEEQKSDSCEVNKNEEEEQKLDTSEVKDEE